MKTVLPLLVLVAAAATSCQAVDAWAEQRASSGTLSNARVAMANQDYERAIALFETVLKNPDHDSEIRAEARLNIALVYLSDGFARRDPVEGMNRLADVRDKHPDYRLPEIRALLQLLMDNQTGVDDGSRLMGEVARLESELERMRAAVRAAADSALDEG